MHFVGGPLNESIKVWLFWKPYKVIVEAYHKFAKLGLAAKYKKDISELVFRKML
jgi:hypothetical protein